MLRVLVLVLFLTPAALAQTLVSARLTSVSRLSVVATAPSGTVARTLPAKSNVTKPFDLLAITPSREAFATYIVIMEGAPQTGWRAYIRDVGDAAPLNPGSATSLSGLNVIRMDLKANRATLARIIVTLQARALGSTAVYSTQVDISDDGSIDFTGTHTSSGRKEFTVQIGVNGLPIKISTGGATGNNTQVRRQFIGDLTIEVRPVSGCTATPFGEGCIAGPKLTGRMTWDHALLMMMPGNTPNVTAVAVFGTQILNVPLPTHLPRCLLHTNPAVMLWTRADGVGNVRVEIPVLPGLLGSANTQILTVQQTLGSLDIRSGNALAVTCR